MSNYIPSVGMEVHAELATRSKMFCRCEVAFGGKPNTRVCPVCLALPGSLPVPNHRAIEMVLKTALALNCQIAQPRSLFHRKNYFYPDLPKGYQITQYEDTNPIGYDGYLDIPTPNGPKRIHIRRVHLEEDTGKLMHLAGGTSGIDYNRAGVPLMEIVTGFNPETGRPDIATPDEAREYLQQLRQILLYLGVCDGKMEEGSLRCEPNISIRHESQTGLGTKTELKNLNSFKSVQLGVAFEVRRHVALLEHGEKVPQETRGWNEEKGASYLMRTKEEENDYRYFPDPDLVPIAFTDEEIDAARSALPELPMAKERRYEGDFGLNRKHAEVLVADREWADFFEAAVATGGDPQTVCNFMISDFAKLLNSDSLTIRQSRVTPAHLVDLSRILASGSISSKIAKELLAESYRSGRMPTEIATERGATQISDESAIAAIVDMVLVDHADIVAKYRAGNVGVKGFLVGQTMKASGGRANPQLAQRLVQEALDR